LAHKDGAIENNQFWVLHSTDLRHLLKGKALALDLLEHRDIAIENNSLLGVL